MELNSRDSYLETLLDPYINEEMISEPAAGSFLSHLTFLINGTTVSGRPISATRYYERTRGQIVEALERDSEANATIASLIDSYNLLYDTLSARAHSDDQKLEELQRGFDEELPEGELYTDEQEAVLEKYRRTFLHLEDVVIVSGSQRLESELFRIRLSDINGWALGEANGPD
jgi:hypothetical protein